MAQMLSQEWGVLILEGFLLCCALDFIGLAWVFFVGRSRRRRHIRRRLGIG